VLQVSHDIKRERGVGRQDKGWLNEEWIDSVWAIFWKNIGSWAQERADTSEAVVLIHFAHVNSRWVHAHVAG